MRWVADKSEFTRVIAPVGPWDCLEFSMNKTVSSTRFIHKFGHPIVQYIQGLTGGWLSRYYIIYHRI